MESRMQKWAEDLCLVKFSFGSLWPHYHWETFVWSVSNVTEIISPGLSVLFGQVLNLIRIWCGSNKWTPVHMTIWVFSHLQVNPGAGLVCLLCDCRLSSKPKEGTQLKRSEVCQVKVLQTSSWWIVLSCWFGLLSQVHCESEPNQTSHPDFPGVKAA